MEGIIEKLKNNVLTLDISTELYQKEAILFTAHKFTDRCYVDLVSSSKKRVMIAIRTKNPNIKLEDFTLEFCNELLDQQIRLNVENSYGNIRNLIVKQAFQPVENIQNEIEK